MEPIVLEFVVGAGVEHVFNTWTERCSLWWPPSHSMSQTDGFDVVFEPFIGGRVYERGADGEEHDWGEITVWDPPHRVEYLWHIFLDRERATKVGLTFTPAEQGTLVRLENTGFGIFGDGAPERIDRVEGAWGGITRQFREAF
jgi:uncharacterized protein YndB with AHSA1/START domain